MGCYTGSGATLEAVFTSYGGDPNGGHNEELSDMVDGLDIQSMGNWNVSIADIRAPRLRDAYVGAEANPGQQYTYPVVRYCIGDAYEHETFEVVVYHEPNVNLGRLIGKFGTYKRKHQDGSYWLGEAVVVSADLMPTEEVNELNMSTLQIRYTAGAAHYPFSG